MSAHGRTRRCDIARARSANNAMAALATGGTKRCTDYGSSGAMGSEQAAAHLGSDAFPTRCRGSGASVAADPPRLALRANNGQASPRSDKKLKRGVSNTQSTQPPRVWRSLHTRCKNLPALASMWGVLCSASLGMRATRLGSRSMGRERAKWAARAVRAPHPLLTNPPPQERRRPMSPCSATRLGGGGCGASWATPCLRDVAVRAARAPQPRAASARAACRRAALKAPLRRGGEATCAEGGALPLGGHPRPSRLGTAHPFPIARRYQLSYVEHLSPFHQLDRCKTALLQICARDPDTRDRQRYLEKWGLWAALAVTAILCHGPVAARRPPCAPRKYCHKAGRPRDDEGNGPTIGDWTPLAEKQ